MVDRLHELYPGEERGYPLWRSPTVADGLTGSAELVAAAANDSLAAQDTRAAATARRQPAADHDCRADATTAAPQSATEDDLRAAAAPAMTANPNGQGLQPPADPHGQGLQPPPNPHPPMRPHPNPPTARFPAVASRMIRGHTSLQMQCCMQLETTIGLL